MTGAAQVLKPFAWLALVAFLVGFFGFLAVNPPPRALAAHADSEASLTSGPASADWNLPKHI